MSKPHQLPVQRRRLIFAEAETETGIKAENASDV